MLDEHGSFSNSSFPPRGSPAGQDGQNTMVMDLISVPVFDKYIWSYSKNIYIYIYILVN